MTLDFVSSNLGEVAFLRQRGIEPAGHVVNGTQVLFCYPPNPDITRALEEYRGGPLMKFDSEVRAVARLVRDIKASRSSSRPMPPVEAQ
jgi:hypothetical protein